MPNKLWGEEESIVTGGTCAIVLKLPKSGLHLFLQKHVAAYSPADYQNLLDTAKEWREESQRDCVFLKVRTRDTSVRFENGFRNIWSTIQNRFTTLEKERTASSAEGIALKEFLDTYIIQPHEDVNFILCVMADRGIPFQKYLTDNAASSDRSFNDLANLIRMLNELKDKTTHIGKYIVHGDTMAHNVVFSGRQLHLIDYDEGVLAKKSAPRRNLDKKDSWQQAVFYPNVLRNFGERYTQIQLLALMVLSLYNDNTKMKNSCEGQSKAGGIGKSLAGG